MKVYQALKIYFGYTDFKNGQENLIRGILAGKDAVRGLDITCRS